MTTGKKPASLAGKELSKKSAPKSEKTVAGSALAQAKPNIASKKKSKK